MAPSPADDLAPSATQGLWSVAADLNGHEAPHAHGWRLDLLREQIPSPSTSGILGHEPVGGQDSLLQHSWHCFSYPDELTAPPHNVTVNERGLLADRAVSERVVTHCQADRRPNGELWVGLRLCLV